MKRRIFFYGLLAFIGIVAIVMVVFSWPPSYTYHQRVLPATFDEYYRQQLDTSRTHQATPGNEEKLVRHSNDRTHIAILYIHGFGASRAEGEYVVDSLANLFNANVYYLRLPGHGTNYEEQATVSFRDYLDDAITSLKMMHLLGDKVIVVGTSMGGLIATYLAAKYPQLVDGLILCSPFYDYGPLAGKAIKVPGVLPLVKLLGGPLRNAAGDSTWRKMIQPGYSDHWYTTQKYDAMRSLEDLRKFIACNATFSKVQAPVLLLYYYRDKEHYDHTASIDAMRNAFENFCGEKQCEKKMIPVADGAHVLTSYYVHSDKGFIIKEMADYLKGF